MNDGDRLLVVNDAFLKEKKPAVSATSRGLMYGDGCFETFCTYHGRFFKLDEHLDRLRSGLQFLDIDFPGSLTTEKIKPLLAELLSHNNLHDKKAIVRLQVWRDGERGYKTDSSAAQYSIICLPAPKDKYVYRLATVDIKRIPSAALPSQYKFTNGLNYITAANQAEEKGSNDALMETVEGFISETTIANIFWLQGNTVFTPSKSCDILPGITREIILELLARHSSIKIEEGEFGMEKIKEAKSVWICNSVKEIMPVSHIDETRFDINEPFLKKLQADFSEYLNMEFSSEG